MGRPPRFSRAEIEDAALGVLDRDGAVGLTIRAVARELGTGPMTLYNYVEDSSALEEVVVDRVLHDAGPLPAPTDDWRADVTAIAVATWRAVHRHPHVIPLVLGRRSRSPIFLDTAELLLDALARSGREGSDLLVAFRAVTTFATAFALTELASPAAAAREDPAAVVERFRSLPEERYPHLIEIAGAARTSLPETEFLSGLEALLDGLSP